MLDLRRVLASKPRKPEHVELTALWTPWGEKIAAGEEEGCPRRPIPALRWRATSGPPSTAGGSAPFCFCRGRR